MEIKTKPTGIGWRLTGAAIGPFVLASAYLLFSHWRSDWFGAFSDYAGMAVSVLAGAAFVAILPIRPLQRVVSLALYIPLLATLLFFYTFLVYRCSFP
jgi:hypothetical protein